MELRAPLSFGGRYYLAAVSVGRDLEDERVHDCAGCGGYVYRDRWHLTATVVDGGAASRDDRGRDGGRERDDGRRRGGDDGDGREARREREEGDGRGPGGQRERYHYCGDDCLRGWLSVAAR